MVLEISAHVYALFPLPVGSGRSNDGGHAYVGCRLLIGTGTVVRRSS